jgi:hypothetical protein
MHLADGERGHREPMRRIVEPKTEGVAGSGGVVIAMIAVVALGCVDPPKQHRPSSAEGAGQVPAIPGAAWDEDGDSPEGGACGGYPPPNHGRPCNDCGGTVQCDGSCPRATGPFEPPQRHPLSSPGRDDSLVLSADRLLGLIASDRPGGVGGTDIYLSTRSSPGDAFSAPTLVAGVNTDAYERSPRISRDLLRLYLESDRSADSELYVARRPDTASPFRTSALGPPGLPGVNDTDPFLMPDELTIYFSSNRILGKLGSRDIYRASRASGDTRFGPAAPVPGLSSPEDDMSPLVTKDELVVYFASSRRGPGSRLDVYRATRASKTAPFDPPVPVAELNTPADEYPTWISPDECELYLSSDRSAAGDRDLYRAVRRASVD